jgi:hypothetical protein
LKVGLRLAPSTFDPRRSPHVPLVITRESG